VCVDEHKLLKDIERLIKREIPKQVFDDFKPDASIKAEPINQGRGRPANASRKPAGNKNSGKRNPPRNQSRGHSGRGNSPRNSDRNSQRAQSTS